MLSLAAVAIMGAVMSSAHASDPVLLHAAGSLRGALTDVAKAFETASGIKVQANCRRIARLVNNAFAR